MFQRIGASAYKANLDNTLAMDKILNNPHKKFRSIHVAGTNGKGSTSHYLASILQEAGYKTGLYTSPHLINFRERIKINGVMIEEQYILDFINNYKQEFETIEPSFFEWTVGLAFNYFADEKIDIAIIETGMGGRLDSTNIITPLLSIITNISFDHKQILGNTLPLIAKEKAGIIKQNIPIVIGESNELTKPVFEEMAANKNATIYFADSKIVVKQSEVSTNNFSVNVFDNDKLIYNNLVSELTGNYQLKNIATVIKATQLFNDIGVKVSKKNVIQGIAKVITNTGLLGRWQTLSDNPKLIADTGHNIAGIEMVLHQLKKQNAQKIHFVLGFVSDKDVAEILNLLPKNATYYFCEPSIPRAMKIDDLKVITQPFFSDAKYFKTVSLAVNEAKQKCLNNEIIFVGGSTFVVADVLNE